MVVVGSLGGDAVSGAMVDQNLGAELAVGHSLTRGTGGSGTCRAPGLDRRRARAEGWRDGAARTAGLDDDLLVEGDWSAGSGYEIGRKLAAERTRRHCLWATTRWRWACLRAFSEAGVRVPDDVSVVGFDDQPESGYFTPPLTTVRQDFEELGRRCMDLMLARRSRTARRELHAWCNPSSWSGPARHVPPPAR